MSEAKSSKRGNRLDLMEIRKLAELMEMKDLVEVEIEQEGKRVHVLRGGPRLPQSSAPPLYPQPQTAPQPMQQQMAPLAAQGMAPAPAPASRGTEIPSPMVGTFYRSAGPDSAPFVEVGDRVGKNTVVCIVEAMKVMNEIKSEVEGEILEVLVQNSEPVEYGQALFLVRPVGGVQ